MGQCHQAFAIARVVPHGGTRAYYRCIAAWHHQLCYDTLPVKAAHRFIELLKHPDNAHIVRHEIAAIHGKYGRFGQEPRIPDMPCGYVAWLLGQAWNYDLEPDSQGEPYISGTSFCKSLLEAGMSSRGGDNGGGMTVIDVTDPMHPECCFLRGGIMHARGFMYYPRNYDSGGDGSLAPSLHKLDGVRGLSLQALAESWPHEYRPKVANETTEAVDDPQVSGVIPSLASLAIEAAISSDNSMGLENLVWMPDKAVLVAKHLRTAPSIPDSAMNVLVKLSEHEMRENSLRLDLSAYALTPEQVISCISKLEPGNIVSLTVPKSFTIDSIRELLTIRPAIRRLDLLLTSISNGELAKLLREEPRIFYQVESLVHSLSLLPGPDNTYAREFAPAFSLLHLTHCNTIGGGGFSGASLPLLYPPQVVRALTDYLTLFTTDNFRRDTSLAAKDMIPHVLMGAASRVEGVPWSKRHVNSHPKSSSACLYDAGWMFIMSFPGFSGQACFGFVKMNPKALVEKTQEMMEAQGRLAQEAGDLEAAAAILEEGEAKEEMKKAAELAMSRAYDAEPTETVLLNGDEHLVCGLDKWLAIMKEEGRPIPSDAAVHRLNAIMEEMLKRPEMRTMTLNDVPAISSYAKEFVEINRVR